MSFFDRLRPVLVLSLLFATAGCNNGSSTPTAPDQSAVAYSQTDLTVGTGTEATVGTTATVQYGGWVYSDTAGRRPALPPPPAAVAPRHAPRALPPAPPPPVDIPPRDLPQTIRPT